MSALNSVSEALEVYVRPFEAEPDDWSDVLHRATASSSQIKPRGSRRRRLLAVALAVAILVALGLSPVGSAVAREISDFSAWLTGSPGAPASAQEQQAFDETSERSWVAFPDGPKLRRLIVTQAAGGTVELYGFRSADSLCLRIVVHGIAGDDFETERTDCIPLRELQSADAPAVVTLVDYTFGSEDVPPTDEGFIPARVSTSFGVVADGVVGVEVMTSEGAAEATVRNNSFLAVNAHPPLGLRTKSVTVVTGDGERVPVPLAESPGRYGLAGKPGVAPGPTEIDRRVDGGSIGWLVRGEPRGQSIEEAGLKRQDPFLNFRQQRREVLFARVIKPDADGLRLVAIGVVDFEKSERYPILPHGKQVCWSTLAPGQGGSGGCLPMAGYFRRGPFVVTGVGGGPGGSQLALVQGLASDDVARMELYTASGERLAVSLRDNVYLIEVARLSFPIRLVGYDARDRVIGIETFGHDPLADPGPRPVEGEQRVVRRVVAPDGAVATLRMGPSTDGTVCWQIGFRDGRGMDGCQQEPYRGPALALSVDSTGVVMGTVSPRVERVELQLRNGERLSLEPTKGVVVLHILTRDEVATGAELAIGFDGAGEEVGRQRFERMPS